MLVKKNVWGSLRINKLVPPPCKISAQPAQHGPTTTQELDLPGGSGCNFRPQRVLPKSLGITWFPLRIQSLAKVGNGWEWWSGADFVHGSDPRFHRTGALFKYLQIKICTHMQEVLNERNPVLIKFTQTHLCTILCIALLCGHFHGAFRSSQVNMLLVCFPLFSKIPNDPKMSQTSSCLTT